MARKKQTETGGIDAVVKKGVNRRTMLKGAAAVAGVAIGSKAIGGFPTIWAQEIKDITLTHVGMSYSTIIDIAKQASKDLGFKIEMAVTDHPGFVTRVTTQPESVDVADGEIRQRLQMVPRGVLQGVETKKIKLWDKVTPIYTKGEFAGKPTSRSGVSPYEVMYLDGKEGTKFHDGPTEWATMLPGVYNADTLGMRPDLIKRPIESWAELVNPEFKGKTAIQDIPEIGILDAAMALQAAGKVQYADMGEMTKKEIDATIEALIELKKQGHFRALWNTFDQSVQLMAAGEVVIQSMWSPAVTAVRSQGKACTYVPLKEGYRGWGNGISLMKHLSGKKLDAAYEYLNWYNSGWVGGFIAKQGYYSANVETAKAALTENERGFFYEGKAATADITSPTGEKTNSAGEVRDGGSYEERFAQVAVWNNLMDEAEFLFAKWNEFNAA